MKSRRGFTIIETIVSVGIFALLIVVLFDLYREYGTLFSLGDTEYSTANAARVAIADWSTYTRQAHRVLASQTINGALYSSATGAVVLQLPAINVSGDVVPNRWDYLAYFTTGTFFERALQADPSSARVSTTTVVATSVVSSTFAYDNSDLTKVKTVTLDVSSTLQENHLSATNHLKHQAVLRNY